MTNQMRPRSCHLGGWSPILCHFLCRCHFLVRTRVPGPLPASARATSRNVCMVASATVETVRVRQGVWAAISITR